MGKYIAYRIYNATLNYSRWMIKCRLDSIVRHLLVQLHVGLLKLKTQKTSLHARGTFPEIIVSITSFPSRINNIHLVIKSLINQSVKPDKIILWLSKEQFPDGLEGLPKKLKYLISKGLEIRFVDGDLKSHKKYIYAFQEFPYDYVMLADDDILYPEDTIEELMSDIKPGKINCSYGSIICYDTNGRPLPYSEWKPIWNKSSNPDFFFGSGGGTMVIPSSFNSEVLNIKKAISLCPTADDIWLNAMARLSGLKIEKVREGLIFPVKNSDEKTLASQNVSLGRNDIQIAAVLKEYPDIFTIHN